MKEWYSLFLLFIFLLSSGPCSYYVKQRYGRFTSPNYPSCYPNNQHCTWLIEAPSGYNYIYLYFESFNLDCYYCQWGYCYWDYVEIFDGSSSYSPRITKACGQLPPWELYSSGRFLLVKFNSNGFYSMPGFSASYRAVSYSKRHAPFISSPISGVKIRPYKVLTVNWMFVNTFL